jgi:thiamine biosynthesis protein ThiI
VNYELIIVRYGELALKGKQSRKIFENTLIQNIRNAFDKQNITGKIVKEWGRIFVFSDEINKCIDVLKKIFGITSISPARKTNSDMKSITKLALDISKEFLNKNKSFAIRAKRTGEHEYSSQDVAVKVGNEIVKAIGSTVDLNKPNFELFIEIRGVNAFLFTEKISSVGGLPLGSQGNICAIINSPESILAAWYLMKRGCNVFFVTDINFTKLLESFIENWFAKSNILKFNSKSNYFQQLNEIIEKKNCDAISVGSSLSINPRKVLDGIKELKRNIDCPILHPLIAMDKEEIFEKCKVIGLKL